MTTRPFIYGFLYPVLFIAVFVASAARARADTPQIPEDTAVPKEATMAGTVTHVPDGDTIVVGALRIDLMGIAAPPKSQPGGAEATTYLRELVEGRTVNCLPAWKRQAERAVKTICFLAGADIGLLVVRSGFARDCPRFSEHRYGAAEAAAQAAGKDLSRRYLLPGYCREK